MIVEYRQFTDSDTADVYRMFRASVTNYVMSIGLMDRSEHDDVDAAWDRQGGLFSHLSATADQDWVAESESGIVGWARAIERDGHVQLTHFFVDPSTQGQGVGRGLLERALPLDWGHSRSIIALQNPLALGLYLRFGVRFNGTSIDLYRKPHGNGETGGVELVPADGLDEIRQMDTDILGYDRLTDLEFLAGDRGAFLCVRGADIVGYTFGHDANYTGPTGVIDPADMGFVFAKLDRIAAERELEVFHFTIPANAHNGVRWALEHGYRIDPFFEMLLSSEPMRLDRFMMTQPSFIW